ncbi:MAG TPA: hypothetical protein VGD46_16170 [Rhizobacter sp.]
MDRILSARSRPSARRAAHDALVHLAERWLRRRGFGVTASELHAAGCREQMDAIGYRTNATAIVECKTSRADFRADFRKPERQSGGLGVYRFYLCSEGMIAPEDLPPRWGLLWARGARVIEVKVPTGNNWPGFDPAYPYGDWAAFMHEPDYEAERIMLFSIARRLAAGQRTQRTQCG